VCFFPNNVCVSVEVRIISAAIINHPQRFIGINQPFICHLLPSNSNSLSVFLMALHHTTQHPKLSVLLNIVGDGIH
jgi:hypothetical protein